MGRIKTKLIKRVGHQLVKAHPDKFTKDFDHNKSIIAKYADIKTKKLRNVIAGYVGHLSKQGEE